MCSVASPLEHAYDCRREKQRALTPPEPRAQFETESEALGRGYKPGDMFAAMHPSDDPYRSVSSHPQNALPPSNEECSHVARGHNSQHDQMHAALHYAGEESHNRRVSSKPQNAAPLVNEEYSHVARGQSGHGEQMHEALHYAGQESHNGRVSSKPQNTTRSPNPAYSHVARGQNDVHDQMRAVLNHGSMEKYNRRVSSRPQNTAPLADSDYSHIARGADNEHSEMRAAMNHGIVTDYSRCIPDHAGTTEAEYSHVARGHNTEHDQMGQALNHGIGGTPARTEQQLKAAMARFPFAYSSSEMPVGVPNSFCSFSLEIHAVLRTSMHPGPSCTHVALICPRQDKCCKS